MRYHFLFLTLLLAAEPALAQHAPAARPAASATALAAAPDTVAALHRLFAGHRQRRNIIAANLGLGFIAGTAGSLATAEEPSGSGRNILDLDSAPSSGAGSSGSHPSASSGSAGATGWLLCAAFTAPLIALDYVVYAKYSRKLEKKAVADYEAGRLASRLRKRLRAKYFQPIKAS